MFHRGASLGWIAPDGGGALCLLEFICYREQQAKERKQERAALVHCGRGWLGLGRLAWESGSGQVKKGLGKVVWEWTDQLGWLL